MSAAFVTIVSGLPRSGTSLLMQMLGAGGLPLLADEIRVADESNPAGYMEYEPVKQIGRDVSWFAGAAGRAVKITIPLLMSVPPQPPARVLLLTRDLHEVAASQAAMLQRLGKPVRFTPAELVPALLALTHRADSFLALRPEIRVHRIAFSALFIEPLATSRGIAAALDLPLDSAAMAACIRPQRYRERSVTA